MDNSEYIAHLEDLAIFMCDTWVEMEEVRAKAISEGIDVLKMEWPVIQGTRQRADLKKVAKCIEYGEFNGRKIGKAVTKLIEERG